MFEVGKKYQKKTLGPNATVMECVVVVGEQACLKSPLGDLIVRYKDDFKLYDECKEPKTIVRYINVYPLDQVSQPYRTRRDADFSGGQSRVACKRVEITYTEGELDP